MDPYIIDSYHPGQMPDYSGLLGEGGAFEKNIPGFTPRVAQQALAEAIHRAIANNSSLVAEAGTGTGKTFAYLIPALLSGKRILISSGTRTLQDQLFHRDLPNVRGIMGMPVKTALLKGRSNYLCIHRLGLTIHNYPELFDKHSHQQDLARINDWAGSTHDGDVAELGSIPEDSPLWQMVTSTVDNCLGQECPDYVRCHVLEARRRAQNSDIVIINHHLLLADMLLKEEGFGALLPGADAVIVDEAHQLPDIASQHFSTSFSSHRMLELLRDCRKECSEVASDMPDLSAIVNAIESDVCNVQLQISKLDQRAEWKDIKENPELKSSLEWFSDALVRMANALTQISERSVGLKSCSQRASLLVARLGQFVEDDQTEANIRWIERVGSGFRLNLMPLDTASRFHSSMHETGCPWVFISASLSVKGGFGHFRGRLGITEAEELLLGSPFDYERNALLYIPDSMPDVNTPGYTAAVVQAVLPVLKAAGGRAFLLFTSHRAMREAADMLRGQIEFPLLVQGDAPRHRLLEKFRVLGNAVLLGTASFWEGVDVKGPALSVVMIDRLPFASPGDPVMKARLSVLEGQGQSPFIDYQLPQAVLALKQGVGRLIRDDTDRGVLMLCDPRVISRGYGRTFLDSLPPMQRTRDLSEVQQFLARIFSCQSENLIP